MSRAEVFRDGNIAIAIRHGIGHKPWQWVCEADEEEGPFAIGYAPTFREAVAKATDAATAYREESIKRIAAWGAAWRNGGG